MVNSHYARHPLPSTLNASKIKEQLSTQHISGTHANFLLFGFNIFEQKMEIFDVFSDFSHAFDTFAMGR